MAGNSFSLPHAVAASSLLQTEAGTSCFARARASVHLVSDFVLHRQRCRIKWEYQQEQQLRFFWSWWLVAPVRMIAARLLSYRRSR